jgi:hypothetical protein
LMDDMWRGKRRNHKLKKNQHRSIGTEEEGLSIVSMLTSSIISFHFIQVLPCRPCTFTFLMACDLWWKTLLVFTSTSVGPSVDNQCL